GEGVPALQASINAPAVLAFDTARNFLYVTDTSNTRVRRVIMATTIISTYAGQAGTTLCTEHSNNFGDNCPPTRAILDAPEGIGVDILGNLYIADSGACEIREVPLSQNIILLGCRESDMWFFW